MQRVMSGWRSLLDIFRCCLKGHARSSDSDSDGRSQRDARKLISGSGGGDSSTARDAAEKRDGGDTNDVVSNTKEQMVSSEAPDDTQFTDLSCGEGHSPHNGSPCLGIQRDKRRTLVFGPSAPCTSIADEVRGFIHGTASSRDPRKPIAERLRGGDQTAEEVHRRYIQQLQRMQQRRHRHKADTCERAVDATRAGERRTPTPFPDAGRCLDERLLLKRKMTQNVTDALFEEAPDSASEGERCTTRRRPRRGRPSQRMQRGLWRAWRRSPPSLHGPRRRPPPPPPPASVPIHATAAGWRSGRTLRQRANRRHRRHWRNRRRLRKVQRRSGRARSTVTADGRRSGYQCKE